MIDKDTLSQVIQMIITIVTTVGSLWAIFNKKTEAIQNKLDSRMQTFENKVSSYIVESNRKVEQPQKLEKSNKDSKDIF